MAPRKRKLYTGPRGGKYYKTAGGGKRYIKRKKTQRKRKTCRGRGCHTRGWGKQKPNRGTARNVLYKKCGSKCFMVPGQKKFPVCAKCSARGRCSCRVDCKGLAAAYIRARQHRKRYPGLAAKVQRKRRRHGCVH